MTKKKVISLIGVVILAALIIGLAIAWAQPCPATCSPGWHSCPTANGQCGCFLDAQGPCPK